MAKYKVDPELLILKPLKFKRYTKGRRMMANAVINFTMFFSRPKKGLKEDSFGFVVIST